jgi:hypothetical protein
LYTIYSPLIAQLELYVKMFLSRSGCVWCSSEASDF